MIQSAKNLSKSSIHSAYILPVQSEGYSNVLLTSRCIWENQDVQEVRSRSVEWEVFPDAPAQERFPMPGAFPDAPAQERFPAPRHRSISWCPGTGAFPGAPAQERVEKDHRAGDSTGGDVGDSQLPSSRRHTRDTATRGAVPLETGTETGWGVPVLYVNENMPTSNLGGKARPSGLWSWAICSGGSSHLPPSPRGAKGLDSTSSAPAFNTPIGRPGPQISSLWKSAGPVPLRPKQFLTGEQGLTWLFTRAEHRDQERSKGPRE